ncbi:MAG: hypothetical protein GDA40_05095 [Rhodobacteraceae bacterium]|nr:hypothetical protein [Paracoccaceae bacterium]
MTKWVIPKSPGQKAAVKRLAKDGSDEAFPNRKLNLSIGSIRSTGKSLFFLTNGCSAASRFVLYARHQSQYHIIYG